MKGRFITFEGTEGSGKSTQISLLNERLRERGLKVRLIREPGGTPIGEEIRHTLKHSKDNHAMMAETELLLMNASRAQLVRETIRPAIAAAEPERIKVLDATGTVEKIREQIWKLVELLLKS